jgi:hypothetical protein
MSRLAAGPCVVPDAGAASVVASVSRCETAAGVLAACEVCQLGYGLIPVTTDAYPDELQVECPECGGPVYVIDPDLVETAETTRRIDQLRQLLHSGRSEGVRVQPSPLQFSRAELDATTWRAV